MKKILFVDDEPEVLHGLKRMLRAKRNEWQNTFMESGQQALELLERESFDVIVCDNRMPGMDGAQLLEKVRDRYPHMVRIILSGHAGEEKIMRVIQPAHQYLAKPVDKDALYGILSRALDLGRVLGDASLAELISRLGALPGLPEAYNKLVEAIENQESLGTIGKIIEHDVGMTATILKLVNSAFFGVPRKIEKPSQAVNLLGLDVIKSLVLTYQLFNTFDMSVLPGFSFDNLWRHCVTTAGLAKSIAGDLGLDKNSQDDAFIAGMLHDVGKLLVGTLLTERYTQILQKVRSGVMALWEAEMEFIGTTHAEAGAYLMGLWGMPDEVILAMAYHHRPNLVEQDRPGILTAVHVGDVLEHELVVIHEGYIRPNFDEAYLNRLGLIDKIPVWRELCKSVIDQGSKDGDE